MWTPQYYVRFLDFPSKVLGVTVPNDDGTFDIYISRHLSDERRQECLRHELRHIMMDHFYSSRQVRDLELEANALSPAPPVGLPSGLPAGLLHPALDIPTPASIPHFPTLNHLRLHLLRLTPLLTNKKGSPP